MPPRKQRRKKKYLGKRRCGRGNVKNRRGSGNRGGRGMAGVDKHKWTWAMAHQPDYYSKHGFVNPTRKRYPTINLYEINQMALNGKLEEKEGKYVFEFKGKVLGRGKVTLPLSIKALSWSKNVERKLAEVKGEIAKL